MPTEVQTKESQVKPSFEVHAFDPFLDALDKIPLVGLNWREARGTFAPHTVEVEGTSYVGSLSDQITSIRREEKYVRFYGENDKRNGISFEQLKKEVQHEMKEIREQLRGLSGQELKDALDAHLPEVFAQFSYAIQESLGFEKIYDSQLRTAIAMHDGKVAELPTGEGKTIGIAHAAALNALTGKGVHVITANNHLAARDAANLGEAYDKLGLTVAVILSSEETGTQEQYLYDPDYPGDHPDFPHLRHISREEAYLADITYGMDHAFMTDALIDEQPSNVITGTKIQRNYIALVDEADDVMVDTAEVPHILGGLETVTSEKKYMLKVCDIIAKRLEPTRWDENNVLNGNTAEFEILNDGQGPGSTQFNFSERGAQNIWSLLKENDLIQESEELTSFDDLFNGNHTELLQGIFNALRANHVFKKGGIDGHYQVKDGKVFLTHKGILQQQTRLANGMHQALEAKEGVEILPDMISINQIGVPEYFRRYERIGATTGSAKEAADVFYRVYKMDVVEIPPTFPPQRELLSTQGILARKDGSEGLYAHAVEAALQTHETGQPVIVFATSVEDADSIYQRLQKIFARKTIDAISAILQDTTQTGRYISQEQANIVSTNLYKILPQETLHEIIDKLQRTGFTNEVAVALATQFKEIQANQQVINLLHATQSADEARIIAQAGKLNAITVTTQMAGRGTDIKPGGDYIIPTFDQWLTQHKGGFHQFLPFEDGGFSNSKSAVERYNQFVAQLKAEQAPLLAAEKEQVNALGGPHLVIAGMDELKRLLRQKKGRTARMGMPGSYEIILSWEDPLFAHITTQKERDQLLQEWGIKLPDPSAKMSNRRRQRISAQRNRMLASDEYQLGLSGLVESIQTQNAAQQSDSLARLTEMEDITATVRKAYHNSMKTFLHKDLEEYIQRAIHDIIEDRIAHPPSLEEMDRKIRVDSQGITLGELPPPTRELTQQELAFMDLQYLFDLEIPEEERITMTQKMTSQEMGEVLTSRALDHLREIRGLRWNRGPVPAQPFEQTILLNHLTLAWQAFLGDIPIQASVATLHVQADTRQSTTFSTAFRLQVQKLLQQTSLDMKSSFLNTLFAPPASPRKVPVLTPLPPSQTDTNLHGIEAAPPQPPGTVLINMMTNIPIPSQE